MQYKGCEIYNDGYGYTIKNSSGKVISHAATDDEAMEYVDYLEDYYGFINVSTTNSKSSEQSSRKSIYQLLCDYCVKMPGKTFVDGKLACIYENPFRRHIDCFNKKHDTKITYKKVYLGGEYFYVVDDIE